MFYFAGFAGVVGLFAYFVSTRPAAFRIARSLTVDAPAPALFALVNDFHEWAAWSPWEKLDPSMHKTFEGPASGKGAVYHYRGNSKVGEGVMTILESTPSSRVDLELRFLKPFVATNKATFTLEPDGSATKVTWAMEGTRNFVMKGFGLFMNMDDVIGKDFASGLAAMGEAAKKKS